MVIVFTENYYQLKQNGESQEYYDSKTTNYLTKIIKRILPSQV